jgi:hypothetical protein
VKKIMPEILKIGKGNARIKSVTSKQVEYLNDAGQDCFVDLEECKKYFAEPGRTVRYVAHRRFLDDPPWIEFKNKRRT